MADSISPHRARYGAPRPPALAGLPLPPRRMPAWRGGRPLKRWRYVAAFSEAAMVCAAEVRIGPARQVFWAVWDRDARLLHGRTLRRRGAVALPAGAVRVADGEIDLELDEDDGVETICPSGHQYAWTRKQGGIAARGRVRGREFVGRAIVDDSAGYHARRTAWFWSAGVGEAADGTPVAWNLVEGINDPAHGSERTVWVAGEPREPPPVAFAADLSAVGALRFAEETRRARDENLLLVRSRYVQPFGTFAGTLPDGTELRSGLGVMERHVVVW
ncbi:MAG: hypothetical protein JWN32_3157 [Solirubrobacterales bacterium]|nr:hypothetical protein [Solirubrobacterales bacterium]